LEEPLACPEVVFCGDLLAFALILASGEPEPDAAMFAFVLLNGYVFV